MNLDAKALVGFIKEIEDSRARQKAETELQRDVFKRAAKKFFDGKAMRIVLQRRAMESSVRDEQDYNVECYELALAGKRAAIEALERGASIREAADAGGISTGAAAALAKGVQESPFVNGPRRPITLADIPHNAETGEIVSAGPDTPPGEGAGTTDINGGPGSALASNAAPEGCVDGVSVLSAETVVPPVQPPQADDVPALSVTPVPDEGVGTGTHSDAARLRAQIPSSTDPERLEREAIRCLSGRGSRSDEHSTAGFVAGNSAHEGESNGNRIDDGGRHRERPLSGGGAHAGADGNGQRDSDAGRESLALAEHAGSGGAAPGRLRAAADADQCEDGRPTAGTDAGHVGVAALHGRDDEPGTQPAGRDLHAPSGTAVATREEAKSGDDAGHLSEPSGPAEQSVNPASPLGRSSPPYMIGEGKQSGTYSIDAAPTNEVGAVGSPAGDRVAEQDQRLDLSDPIAPECTQDSVLEHSPPSEPITLYQRMTGSFQPAPPAPDDAGSMPAFLRRQQARA